MSGMPACGETEDTSEIAQTEVNGTTPSEDTTASGKPSAGRYALYVSNGEVYCLDTASGESKLIEVSGEVMGVFGVRVGDTNSRMVFHVERSEEQSDLFYWDGWSQSAVLIDENADLIKVSQNMETCIYIKKINEMRILYCFRAASGATRLSDVTATDATMTDDGSAIFFEELTEISNVNTLYKVTADGSKVKLSEVVHRSANMADDYSAMGYLKMDDYYDDHGFEYPTSWPAYIWTPEGGEKELPFRACQISVFGENEIYYSRANEEGCNQYYYDGTQSYLIGEKADAHGHKMGEFYSYHKTNYLLDKEVGYVAYGEQCILAGTKMCMIEGQMEACSLDEKTVYSWIENADKTWNLGYITLQDGQLNMEQGPAVAAGGYAPKLMRFYGDTLLHGKEDSLWINDAMIAEGIRFGEISYDGETVVYWKENALYLYQENGEDEKFWEGEQPDYYALSEGTVLVVDTAEKLYLRTQDGMKTISENVTAVEIAYGWRENEMGNVVITGCGNGMSYYGMMDMVIK